MKIIAHRGLLEGPNPELENRPDQIENALARGFDVEVDVWAGYTHDPSYPSGQRLAWWLGHDEPIYRVSQSFLERLGVWVHCKNQEALANATPQMHYFWHESDQYTMTSGKVIWGYPGKPKMTTKPFVVVLPEREYGEDLGMFPHIAHNYTNVCTDYPLRLYEKMPARK